MNRLPPSHAQRLSLAEEIHARPPLAFNSPGAACYLALLVTPENRQKEFEHLTQLCSSFQAQKPYPGATHHTAQMGQLTFKWERHGEFSGITLIEEQTNTSGEWFRSNPFHRLSETWWQAYPGQTIAAVRASLQKSTGLTDSEALEELVSASKAGFQDSSLVGARVLNQSATVLSDFRWDSEGFTRFAIADHGLSPRQAGQLIQRLFEIEAYRMLCLLALPVARSLSPDLQAIEADLSAITGDIAKDVGDDEQLLSRLTGLAAAVETGIAGSQFRFGACRAYGTLVRNRIQELNEERLDRLPTIDEFMSRRFDPAVATCMNIEQRQLAISERIAQASALLSTRVEITRERQNQRLLSSMDTRARMQLRLQQTVEGLSVAAIVYYLAGLVNYAAKGVLSTGLELNPDLVTAISVPILALLVYTGIKQARRGFAEYGDPGKARK